MDRELVSIKNNLIALGEEQAMMVMPFLKMLVPAIDEVSTEEAYQIFGSKRRFDHHRDAGNIYPIRGQSKKSRKFWSRTEIYNLKKAERIVMNIA